MDTEFDKIVIYPDRLFRATPIDEQTGAFIELWFNSPSVRKIMHQKAKSTAGHQRISQTDIKPQFVPLPPFDEQSSIIEKVQECLSFIDDAHRILDTSMKRAERLRQSILREAFSGRLVPQDPNDEPASDLLKRIRQERARRKGLLL